MFDSSRFFREKSEFDRLSHVALTPRDRRSTQDSTRFFIVAGDFVAEFDALEVPTIGCSVVLSQAVPATEIEQGIRQIVALFGVAIAEDAIVRDGVLQVGMAFFQVA